MFDEKDFEAYREIGAPKELRERVMRLEQKPEQTRARARIIPFGSLAAVACVAVLCVDFLPLFGGQGGMRLSYQGISIGAEPVSIPADHPQMASELREVGGGIPLELETDETTRVSVSGGEFSLFDSNGELLGDGTEAEVSEDTRLYWDLSGTEEATFSLTLETNGKQLTYVLSMRDDGGYDLQETQSPTHK